MSLEGLLVVDKPAGLTSHDVVAAVRRILHEPRVGHTGTLDPAATGVLLLVVGRATRLARFVSAGDKSYDATVSLGVATDTADATGAPVGEPFHGPWPAPDAIDRALDAFRGTFLQQPPVYSAKKIQGRRSYDIARRAAATPNPNPETPNPARVTAHKIDVVHVDGPTIRVTVDCSAGFYVRSLAHDLGQRLGTGAHLASLRRTRTGGYTLADAVTLDQAASNPNMVAGRLIPVSQMLEDLPAVVLTPDGVRRAVHGQDLGPDALVGSHIADPIDAQRPDPLESRIPDPESLFSSVRLLSPTGELVGIAEPAAISGLLHPCVVLR